MYYEVGVNKKISPAILMNKGFCSHQAITLQPPGWWALREPRMETMPTNAATASGVPWGDSKWENPGPRELRCISKEWLQGAQVVHCPTHRKALNSLTWENWFSFIHSNLLILTTWSFVVKIQTSGCLLASLEQSLRINWEAVSCLGLTPQMCPTNKT